MKKWVCMLCSCLLWLSIHAQWTELFSDGDYIVNPFWIATADDWRVNDSLCLQSNNTSANAQFSIATQSDRATDAEWMFDVRLAFNTSSVNYADVFIISSTPVLLQGTTGYFVRIGGVDDDVCLYRKDANGIVKLIDGINGLLNRSDNLLRIKLIRENNGRWLLLRNAGADGINFYLEGTTTNTTYLASEYFMIYVKQSTASFFERHYFDNIVVKQYEPDLLAPVVERVFAINDTTVLINFSEALSDSSATLLSNYRLTGNMEMPLSAQKDVTDARKVRLVFQSYFPQRTNLQLLIQGVTDLWGNATDTSVNLLLVYPYSYDVVIDEIMADPSPPVGLPECEWLELKNVSSYPMRLYNWRICKQQSECAFLPDIVLQPDSSIIITSVSAAAQLQNFGRVAGISSFPALTNDYDLIYLTDASGKVIHAVSYNKNWYNNEVKMNGGWSLEMKDVRNACGGEENWAASTAAAGGTPGTINSITQAIADEKEPSVSCIFPRDSIHLTVAFSESMDSTSLVSALFTTREGIEVTSVKVIPPLFNEVECTLSLPMQPHVLYHLRIAGVTDCAGNTHDSEIEYPVGLPLPVDTSDIVINEILYNPVSYGADYVELFNRGNTIINAKELYLANRNIVGAIAEVHPVTNYNRLLFPGDYWVATEDVREVERMYRIKNPAAMHEVNELPGYPDDKGNVVLLNATGKIIDEVPYKDDWQFALMNDTEGIALERISSEAPSASSVNWQSAATDAGFGTPSYKNSQSTADKIINGEVVLSTKVVSPDNDGIDDYCLINYSFPETGYVCNVTVFDASGRVVRYLERNAFCGVSGLFKWDGLGERMQQLSRGAYIILVDVYNLSGKRRRFKHVVAIAYRS